MEHTRHDTHRPILSVVIPTFRLRGRIEAALRHLEAQTLAPNDYEVIHVDDGSDDGTIDILKSWRPALDHSVLLNPCNRGRSSTRNRGWRQARGEVIVFLDGDMIAHPRLLEIYRNRFARGNVDVVSGRRWCLDLSEKSDVPGTVRNALDPASSENADCGRATDFAVLRNNSSLGPLPNQADLEAQLDEVCARYPESLTRALAFITSNVAVRRDLLCSSQGFVPLLVRGEDTDLGLQLALRGARFAYDSEAEAIHLFSNWTGTSENHQDALAALVTRHPFKAVILWWCWARRHGSGPFARLSDIARAELTGELIDLDIVTFAQSCGIRLPADFSLSRDQLLSYWREISDVPQQQLERWLDGGLARGLIHSRRPNSEMVFDFALTHSWLDDHSEWRQYRFRNSFLSRHLTQRQRGEAAAPPLSLRWDVRYTMEVPRELIECGPTAINLAVPVLTRCQTDVSFGECHPPDLLSYEQNGAIVGYPLRTTGQAVTRLSYSFSCRVMEFDPALPKARVKDEPSLWLRPVSLHNGPGLSRLLRQILVSHKDESASSKARKIYEWMLDNTEYRANALAGLSIVRCGFGHCIQLARLFVALCRLAGIPTRECCGLIIESHRAGAPQFQGESCGCYSPFAHTWAEFYCPEQGWLPVEFLPVGHGRRAVSPWNFPDITDREQLCSEQLLFDLYYFGGLDPFRICTTRAAMMLPQLVRLQAGIWEPVKDSALAVRHRIDAQGRPV